MSGAFVPSTKHSCKGLDCKQLREYACVSYFMQGPVASDGADAIDAGEIDGRGEASGMSSGFRAVDHGFN